MRPLTVFAFTFSVLLVSGFVAAAPLRAQGLTPATPAKEYIRLNGQVIAVESTPPCAYSLDRVGQRFDPTGGTGSFTLSTAAYCAWSVSKNSNWVSLTSAASGSGNGTITFQVAANPDSQQRTTILTMGDKTFSIVQNGLLDATGHPTTPGLRFVPIPPCRVVDTRLGNGPLGGPYLAAQTTRDFPLLSGSCGLPGTAQAYSLNVTVVPLQPLHFLKLWASGQPQPDEATLLNSYDSRVKADAAVVTAGSNGAISVFTTDDTHLILDVNGYFTAEENALSYFPLTPCRIADTRGDAAPSLTAHVVRNFQLAGTCGLPADARAYFLNFAVIPHSPLAYLNAWPAGGTESGVSTLNAPTGTIVANAALVAANSSGQVSVNSSADTDLVIDVSGYFAADSRGLAYYPVAPCRAYDSRTDTSQFFSGTMAVNVAASGCGAASSSEAFLLNATVLPPGSLTFLRLWQDGQAQPVPAVLNAVDGAVTSNLAFVSTGNGSIDAYATNPTYLILDLFGYFALPPSPAPQEQAMLNSTFALSASPSNQATHPSGSIFYNLSVTPQNGFANAVTLGVSGLPPGASAVFSPATVPNGSGSSVLQITTNGVAPGTYSLPLTATSGSFSQSVSLALVVVAPAAPNPASISIDFVGNGTAMSPAEQAGVVRLSHWNSAPGSSSSAPLALMDANGNATGAGVTWSSNNPWALPLADAPGDVRMMKGYLDTDNNTVTTVHVSGLAPSSTGYDVYVYTDGDNEGHLRSGIYQITGPGLADLTFTAVDGSTDFQGTYVEAYNSTGNYLKFTIQGTNFTLTATPGSTTIDTARAPVNGLQIVPSPAPTPAAVSIDFVGSGTPMIPSEAAGVVSKTHWNEATGAASSSPMALVDENGAATGATVTWQADNGWVLPLTDAPGNARMMAGYLDNASGHPVTVTVSNLVSSASGYDVYVYTDGDNASYNRSATYQISGAGIPATSTFVADPANTTFSGLFTPADNSPGNYVKFTIQATGFTLTATPASTDGPGFRAPVNALQIVPSPGGN